MGQQKELCSNPFSLMKDKARLKRDFGIQLFLFNFFVTTNTYFIFLILSLSSSLSWSAPSYRVNNSTIETIDEFGVCQNVNNTTGSDLFVPTNISAEWLAFRTQSPVGVTLTACTLMTDLAEPPNASYGLGSSIDFQVTWSQAITVAGAPRLVLDIGGVTRYATYTAGTGTTSLSFRYTVQAGDTDGNGIALTNNSIDLNGGTLSAPGPVGAGLDMTSFINSLASVIVNTSITPPNQVTGVALAPTTNSTTMGISWAIPNDNGNAITHYIVQYRLQGTSLWTNHSPNPTSNTTTVTGLTSGFTYEVRVAATNGALGPYSAISTAEIFNVLDYNPITWLDGADPNGTGTPPANGSNIATWVNKAGTGTNATEGTPANQPTYLSNVQNGKGAIRFVNHDRGLQGTFTRSTGTALTIIAVVRFDSTFTDRAVFEFAGPGAQRGFFLDRRYASNTVFSPATTKDQFNIYTIVDLGGSGTVTENSTSIYNAAMDFNTDFTGAGNYVLGDDATGGNRLNGYIGEFLIFDAQLSAADILKMKTYLQNKWGTP